MNLIKEVFKKEKEKVLSLIIQKSVIEKWSEKCIKETPQEIKDIDVEQLKKDIKLKQQQITEKFLQDEEKKLAEWEIEEMMKKGKAYEEYRNHLENLNEESGKRVAADIFAWHSLIDLEDEITKLL
jgi:hypothetical protein